MSRCLTSVRVGLQNRKGWGGTTTGLQFLDITAVIYRATGRLAYLVMLRSWPCKIRNLINLRYILDFAKQSNRSYKHIVGSNPTFSFGKKSQMVRQ